jgi:hypothetical protein
MRDVFKNDEREIPMAANAASPFIYSKIFNEDFEKDAESIMAWRKMTYVMVQQANVGEAELLKGKLTESDCIMWLTQFDPLEFADILNFAAELYAKQQKTKSTPKN